MEIHANSSTCAGMGADGNVQKNRERLVPTMGLATPLGMETWGDIPMLQDTEAEDGTTMFLRLCLGRRNIEEGPRR